MKQLLVILVLGVATLGAAAAGRSFDSHEAVAQSDYSPWPFDGWSKKS